METKVYVDDKIAAKWKELAMKRFDYGRGSISKAAEEALAIWIENEEKIAAALEKLKGLAGKEKSIVALLLFGSYARKEPYHDLDIAVIAAEKSDWLKILSTLEGAVPEYLRFDFSLFNEMPASVKSRVLSECTVLYSKKNFGLMELSYKLIEEWSDIKPMLDAAMV
jgi:predicted nucleotidyltransferase